LICGGQSGTGPDFCPEPADYNSMGHTAFHYVNCNNTFSAFGFSFGVLPTYPYLLHTPVKAGNKELIVWNQIVNVKRK
jgi:hypothetical protein